MGKKMTRETVERYARIREEERDSIYTRNNPYGYKLNVNHPLIRPIYERYKMQIGEKILSDAQRLTFELEVVQWLESKGIRKEV